MKMLSFSNISLVCVYETCNNFLYPMAKDLSVLVMVRSVALLLVLIDDFQLWPRCLFHNSVTNPFYTILLFQNAGVVAALSLKTNCNPNIAFS